MDPSNVSPEVILGIIVAIVVGVILIKLGRQLAIILYWLKSTSTLHLIPISPLCVRIATSPL